MFEYVQDALLLATASNPTMDTKIKQKQKIEITLTGTPGNNRAITATANTGNYT